MKEIGIINFPSSNVKNLISSLRRNKCDPKLISNRKELHRVDKLILPGVGSAKAALDFLNQKNMKNDLKKIVNNQTPLLGICLGMQILFKHSDEFNIPCIGLFNGKVKKLSNQFLSVPNIGWHKIKKQNNKNNKITSIFDNKANYFYFIHSYYCLTKYDFDLSFSLDYDYNILAAFEHKNVFCTQFHPELSGEAGDKIIKNFIKI